MKKKLMRFNLAALALVMVTSVLISGTFAKYTTAVSAQDTALIARWDISSTGLGEITYDGEGNPQVQEMDLFGHAYDVAIMGDTNGDGTGTPILGPGVEYSFEVNLKGTADVDATIDLKIDEIENSIKAPIQYAVTKEGETVDWSNETIYYSRHLLAQAILNEMASIADNDMIITNDDATSAQAGQAGEKAIILKNSETTTDVKVVVHWRWPFDASAHDTYTQDMKDAGIIDEEGDAWTNADDTALGLASAAAFESTGRTTYGLKLTLTAEQITPEVSGT